MDIPGNQKTDGIIVVPVVSFRTPEGMLKTVETENWIHHVISWGVDGIVLFGGTGRGDEIDHAEKLDMIRRLRGVVQDHSHLAWYLGIMNADRMQALELAERAAASGVHRLLVLPKADDPSFLPVLADQAQQQGQQIILYHNPGKGSNLTWEVVAGLAAKHPAIAGVKDSSGDLTTLQQWSRMNRELEIILGNAHLLSEGVVLGCVSCIEGAANDYETFASICALFEASDAESRNRHQEGITAQCRRFEQGEGGFVASMERIAEASLPVPA